MKQAHLNPGSMRITRAGRPGAYSLTEVTPAYDGTPESIHRIIDFLDVEKSARYQRTKTSTFCNIYAHDYARALGAYVPRVWWDSKALKRISEGEDVKEIYPRNGVPGTILEMNANQLYDWFREYSGNFGWCKIESNTEAQKLADSGKCVIIVGANLNRRLSGHIAAIVPQTDKHKAKGSAEIGSDFTVTVPLQSQAGGTNWKYRAFDWRKGHELLNMYWHEA